MATGPEHYKAAERCLDSVNDDSDLSLALLAEAQVHATLALAAATALNDAEVGMHEADFKTWHLVAGAVQPLKHEDGGS